MDHTALGHRIISEIARIFFMGNDWAKVMAILNCALHRAIFIPGNFMRLRIIVAHFARTVSEHVKMITRKHTRTEWSYVFIIWAKVVLVLLLF